MGGVSPFSEGGHTHLSWEPLPFPALIKGLWSYGPITGASITCYVASDTTTPRKGHGRMSHHGEWLRSLSWAMSLAVGDGKILCLACEGAGCDRCEHEGRILETEEDFFREWEAERERDLHANRESQGFSF